MLVWSCFGAFRAYLGFLARLQNWRCKAFLHASLPTSHRGRQLSGRVLVLMESLKQKVLGSNPGVCVLCSRPLRVLSGRRLNNPSRFEGSVLQHKHLHINQ